MNIELPPIEELYYCDHGVEIALETFECPACDQDYLYRRYLLVLYVASFILFALLIGYQIYAG